MAFTYTLTSNPGNLFNIFGTQLRTNSGSIVAGNYPITVKADDGAGTVIFQNLMIVATPVSAPPITPALKFNQLGNSQYINTTVGG